MMHIGEDAAYRELFESFAGQSTVVLEEGVTDTGNRLGSGLFYDKVASRIGLEVQPTFEALRAERPTSDSGEPWPELDKTNQVYLNDMMALLSGMGHGGEHDEDGGHDEDDRDEDAPHKVGHAKDKNHKGK